MGGLQLALLLSLSGCGALPSPTDLGSLVEGLLESKDSRIVASVTAKSEDTGLPTVLSGTVCGQFGGTYDEEILAVFFDGQGKPNAALSRSQLTFDAPNEGTLISLNLVVVVDMIFATDENGAPVLDQGGTPVVSGLRSSATGQIIYGSGIFEGATGEIHADSVLSLVGGDFGMGFVESDLSVDLNMGVTD